MLVRPLLFPAPRSINFARLALNGSATRRADGRGTTTAAKMAKVASRAVFLFSGLRTHLAVSLARPKVRQLAGPTATLSTVSSRLRVDVDG